MLSMRRNSICIGIMSNFAMPLPPFSCHQQSIGIRFTQSVVLVVVVVMQSDCQSLLFEMFTSMLAFDFLIRQLSMSETLAQLAHKIDFSQTNQDNAVEEDTSDERADKPMFQPSLWPWDSVRNKLRWRTK